VTEPRDALHRFGLERDRLRSALARAAGLAENDVDALEHLEAAGPLTPGALADRLLLTSGGATVLIDRLEAAGWVRRTPNPDDRRSLLVELDRDRLADAPPALVAYHVAVTLAAHDLPPDESAAVTRFLTIAADAAAAAVDALRKA
jgi:hypothetical protein